MRERQEKIPYLYIKDKFSRLDPGALCAGKKVDYDPARGLIGVKLLGEDYQVSHPGGEVYAPDGREVASYVLKTILLRYLVNGRGAEPSGRFISFRELQDGHLFYPAFYSRTVRRLAGLSQEPERLLSLPPVLQRLPYGDLAFAFAFLPDVIFAFILYRGDEEFPAGANILMDSNIEAYFTAEDIAVVADVAVDYFLGGGRISPQAGLYGPVPAAGTKMEQE